MDNGVGTVELKKFCLEIALKLFFIKFHYVFPYSFLLFFDNIVVKSDVFVSTA